MQLLYRRFIFLDASGFTYTERIKNVINYASIISSKDLHYTLLVMHCAEAVPDGVISAGLGPLHHRHPLVIITEEGEVEVRTAAVGLGADGQLTQQPPYRLGVPAVFGVDYGVLESEEQRDGGEGGRGFQHNNIKEQQRFPSEWAPSLALYPLCPPKCFDDPKVGLLLVWILGEGGTLWWGPSCLIQALCCKHS